MRYLEANSQDRHLTPGFGEDFPGFPAASRPRPPAAACAAIFWLAAKVLLAQSAGLTTGDLRGTVRDDTGSVLPGVSVSAISPTSSAARAGTTGTEGEFVLRFLPPGSYDVTAEGAGLQTVRVEGVVIVAGSAARLDLTMHVSPLAETVTVRAGSQPVDPAATELSTVVTEAEIENLPINRRNYLDFALTTPGVTQDRGPQTGAATTSGLSINGQDPRLNNVLLDGLDDNDAAVGAVRTPVTQEAVREYQVARAPYSAEYGRAGGGVVNVVTRSGSNSLRGSAFVFYRDESLSGRNALAGEKTPYEQFQYGASISGPIFPDRLFYFAAAERLDVTDANVVVIEPDVAAAIEAAGFLDVAAGTFPYERGRTSVVGKIDASLAPSQAWAIRANWGSDTDENQQPWGGLVARSGGGVRDVDDTVLALTGLSLFGRGASNELRALYADRSHRLTSLDASGGPAVQILGLATFGTQQFLPQPRDTRTYEVFDAVSFFAGPTTIKTGVDWVHTELEGILPLYFAGFYQFTPIPDFGLSALEAFSAGIPVAFVQGFGSPDGEVRTDLLSGFAQAEWAPGSRFVIRAGLRYDYENPADPFHADANNWAPRLSLSWAPAETWRARGGLGRFYAVAPIGPMFAVGIENGMTARILLRTGLEDPIDAVMEPWLLPDRRYSAAEEPKGYPPAQFRAGDFDSAYTDLASVGVEKQLGRGWSLALDYVHARGKSILIERNVNPIDPAIPLENGLFQRPDPTHRDIRLYESTGSSWYDAVTLAAESGVGGPLRLAASVTYADAEDDYVDFSVGQPQDPLHMEEEVGPTIHVPKYRGTLAVVYATLAAGPWWARDWTFSAISDLSVGRPFNELAGYDRNQNGDPSSDRPEGVGRNQSTLPAYWNFDLRVGRRIPAGPLELGLTLDVFNLFNRDNVLEVNNVHLQEAPPFGAPTRVSDPTRLQFGLRVTF
jgi:outer membrane receptor for ferrienterochelin and colicin